MQAWLNHLLSWLPLILILAFWVYFVKVMKTSRHGRLTDRSFEHMDRVERLLGRIADSLERQPRT